MGSKMAPSFASLYCGLFEQDTVFNAAHNPHLHNISNWYRYIDDIFFIWHGTKTELQDFFNFINTNGFNLRFTMNCDTYKMNFLDILVYRQSNKLSSSLYRKSTDRNSILHGDSFHPTALKKSLPISQFNRVRRICSSDLDYQTQAEDLVERFQQRQYKQEWITRAHDKFASLSQTQCLEHTRPQRKDQRINCIIQYSPLGKEFQQIINKHWFILQTDPALKEFSLPPRVVYKRPPNLSTKLVRAHLPSLTKPHFLQGVPSGNYRCGHCTQCNFTHKTKTFNHPRTGVCFKIKGVISCNTNNVIYMLKCPCGLAYIGKTSRPLKIRISEHRSNIRNKDTKSPVAVHFAQFHHSVSSLRYLGIELVKLPSRGGNINSLLLKREAYWIYKLDTLSPRGLNEDFDLRPFL